MSISVVIPTYNRGPQIESTLDSVLAQTLLPLEIIVVDDGSSDQTPDWIESRYGARVRVVRQPNGGVARARNRGLQEARGEFIAFLDHDDVWHAGKLETQLAALQAQPDAALCWTKWREVDKTGAALPVESYLWSKPFWRGRSGRVFDDFIHRNLILSASVPLIRAAMLRATGGFDPQTAPSDDWDMWLRLAKKHPFVFVDAVTLDYRRHAGNQSGDEMKMWRGSQKAMIKQWPSLLRHPRALWLMLGQTYFLRTAEPFYRDARRALVRGDWRALKRQMRAVTRRYPLSLLTTQWAYLLLRLLRRDARPL